MRASIVRACQFETITHYNFADVLRTAKLNVSEVCVSKQMATTHISQSTRSTPTSNRNCRTRIPACNLVAPYPQKQKDRRATSHIQHSIWTHNKSQKRPRIFLSPCTLLPPPLPSMLPNHCT
jgi:hypothetical protein